MGLADTSIYHVEKIVFGSGDSLFYVLAGVYIFETVCCIAGPAAGSQGKCEIYLLYRVLMFSYGQD